MGLEYKYITKENIDNSLYREFIEKFHGIGSFEERRQRMLWYWQQGEDKFKVYVAVNNGEYVGQSCAYYALCNINNRVSELWWGVDTFVLSSMRGKGIGKLLQKKLHEDCPNFSSAWYSPTNGIIKRKCGAHGILDFPRAHYPISCFFSIYLELVLKKLVSCKITIPHIRLPYFYSTLNCPNKRWLNNYEVEEMNQHDMPTFSGFMESCLKDEPFRIIRSEEFLRWKYIDNPRMKCHILVLKKGGEIIGLIAFSPIIDGGFLMSKANVVKIYESIFTMDSGLTHRHLLSLVTDYYKRDKKQLDFILSLQSVNYTPVLIYPRPHSELLSTLNIDKMPSGYLTYADQDME